MNFDPAPLIPGDTVVWTQSLEWDDAWLYGTVTGVSDVLGKVDVEWADGTATSETDHDVVLAFHLN